MYPPIEEFTIRDFLKKTYPTQCDQVEIENITEYVLKNLREKQVKLLDRNQFMDSFNSRLLALSSLCKGHENMDKCELNAIENLCCSVDSDLQYILRPRSDIISLGESNYFINLSTFPDTVQFYHNLTKSRENYNMSRKKLEEIYKKNQLDSPYSNVLFNMSWLGLLRVCGNKYVYFNKHPNMFF